MWSELGHAQLEAGAVNDAIGSYLKSGDTSRYSDVILRSRDAGAHQVLVEYLLMVRKKIKEPKVPPAARMAPVLHSPASSGYTCSPGVAGLLPQEHLG